MTEPITPTSHGLETQRVILFLDLLGVKSKWLQGGREAAEIAFKEFRTLVALSLKDANLEHLQHGLVESDSVALTFTNVSTALAVAKAMFTAAFSKPNKRIWLRGCLVAHENAEDLRTARKYSGKLSKIVLTLYSDGLFDAISVEKSGYKGMRLLVEKRLITTELREATKDPIGHLNFMPLCELRSSTYPKRLSKTFVDYLWMGSCKRENFDKLRKTMAIRLKLAASDPEEFIQAAATQVVFHECAAILSSLGGKVHYRQLKSKGDDLSSDTQSSRTPISDMPTMP